MRCFAFGLSSFCIASTLVVACASFGTETVAQPDASGEAGANTPIVEAGGPDALADVPSLPSCTNGMFCERFDDDDWQRRWIITGTLGVSNEAALSPPSALRVLLPKGEGSLKSLSRPLVPLPPDGSVVVPRKFEATVSIFAPKMGSGNVDLFGFDGDNTGGVYLVYAGGTLAFQTTTPSAPSEQQQLNASLEQTFHEVRIAVDLDAQKATIKIDGVELVSGLADTFVPRTLRLGAFYVTQIEDSWDLRFDDVTLLMR